MAKATKLLRAVHAPYTAVSYQSEDSALRSSHWYLWWLSKKLCAGLQALSLPGTKNHFDLD